MLNDMLSTALNGTSPAQRLDALVDLTWNLGHMHLPNLLTTFVAEHAPAIVSANWESESEMDDNGQSFVTLRYFQLVMDDGATLDIPGDDESSCMDEVMDRVDSLPDGDRWSGVFQAIEVEDGEAYLDAIASGAGTTREALNQIIQTIHCIADCRPMLSPLSLRPRPTSQLALANEGAAA